MRGLHGTSENEGPVSRSPPPSRCPCNTFSEPVLREADLPPSPASMRKHHHMDVGRHHPHTPDCCRTVRRENWQNGCLEILLRGAGWGAGPGGWWTGKGTPHMRRIRV